MDKKRVEIIKIAAFLKETGLDGSDFVIAIVKRLAKSPKERCKGQFNFCVRKIDRRVEKGRDAAVLSQYVGCPYVPMDEGWPAGFI